MRTNPMTWTRSVLTLGLVILLPCGTSGCSSTPLLPGQQQFPSVGQGQLPGFQSTVPVDGSKVQAYRAWKDEQAKMAKIDAEYERELEQILMRKQGDVRTTGVVGAARDVALSEAESEIRQRRLGTAADELGHSVRTTTDSERLYWEERARRLELEKRALQQGVDISGNR